MVSRDQKSNGQYNSNKKSAEIAYFEHESPPANRWQLPLKKQKVNNFQIYNQNSKKIFLKKTINSQIQKERENSSKIPNLWARSRPWRPLARCEKQRSPSSSPRFWIQAPNQIQTQTLKKIGRFFEEEMGLFNQGMGLNHTLRVGGGVIKADSWESRWANRKITWPTSK